MVKQAELARQWGVSRVMVFKLVKKGCPLTSLEAANAWKDAHPPKRAATNRKVPAPEAKPVTKTAKAVIQPPRINPKAAKKSRKAATKLGGRSKGPPEPQKPVLPPKPVKSGDSLTDVLNAFIHVHEVSLALFDHACEHSPITIPARMSEHTRAGMARMQAEEKYREEMERRGMLLDKAVAFQTSRQSIEAVLRRLKRMPSELGPQCNPQDPMLATRLLAREVAAITATGAKEIDAIRAARKS